MKGKQKRFLRAMASTMPAVVQIGKNGLDDAVKESALLAINARELIKVKILQNSPVEGEEVFNELAEHMQAELVQIIGKNGVFYKAKKEPKIILPD